MFLCVWWCSLFLLFMVTSRGSSSGISGDLALIDGVAHAFASSFGPSPLELQLAERLFSGHTHPTLDIFSSGAVVASAVSRRKA